MTSEDKQTNNSPQDTESESGQTREAATEAAGKEDNAGQPDVAALLAENAELKDKLLRAIADMDNLRKRLEREKAEAVQYAATQFARDMLNVSDNLARALEAVPEDKRAEGGEFLKTLIEGVEMTLKELLNTFEKHKIRRIRPHGEKFDPNYHQAMFEVTDTEAETGTVVHVMQDGYTYHDRVLRPAMVGVAKKENSGGENEEK